MDAQRLQGYIDMSLPTATIVVQIIGSDRIGRYWQGFLLGASLFVIITFGSRLYLETDYEGFQKRAIEAGVADYKYPNGRREFYFKKPN